MSDKYRKDPEAIARLTPDQYGVTQQDATEPPFRNEFWDNHEPGLYVDVVSGEPLFASVSKFDSGTGWPSFTVPVEAGNVVERQDSSYGMIRTEVRSAHGDSGLVRWQVQYLVSCPVLRDGSIHLPPNHRRRALGHRDVFCGEASLPFPMTLG